MSKRRMILFAVWFAILIVVVVFLTKNGNFIASPEYKKCVNETFVPKEYVRGEIIVGFEKNATEENIKQFIKDSGFKTERSRSYTLFKVPEGKELKIICKFKENEIIRDAFFNLIVQGNA